MAGPRPSDAEPDVPPAAPFIVGVAHSGTTLLRLMLDAHHDLAIPPETNFLPELIEFIADGESNADGVTNFIAGRRRWGDFGLDASELRESLAAAGPLTPARAARAFYLLYASKQGKRRWGDKSPRYARRMARIARHLPEARFIHLIRDGRDVALSRLGRRRDDPAEVTEAAVKWRRRIERARSRAAKVPYLEVRFEALVTETEPTLRRILDFSELEWSPAVLDYHRQSQERMTEMADALPARPGKKRTASQQALAGRRAKRHKLVTRPPSAERIAVWRDAMSDECQTAFRAEAGELLVELGYDER